MKLIIPVTLLLLTILISCAEPPIVIQGVVTSYDPETKILVLNDVSSANRELTISLQGAEIGADPNIGDSVRVAYQDQSGKLIASRLMNLSQQTELKSKGH